MVTVKRLIDCLSVDDVALRLVLPSGTQVPHHFHITEVGKVEKVFVDCGGTKRSTVACVMQAWTAHDVDHRLRTTKLAKILASAESVLGADDLPVEVEYGKETASLYKVVDIETTLSEVFLILGAKKTDCLSPDKCGLTVLETQVCDTVGCC